ncbi:hypothetical protein D3C80_999430 [compost metagenome]
MITVGAILGGRRHARRDRFVHEIPGRGQIAHRHAALGQGEVVRTEVDAGARARIALEAAPLRRRQSDDALIQLGLAIARHAQLAHSTQNAGRIQVEARHRRLQRVQRIGGIEFRSQQAAFLAGEADHDDGALRLRPLRPLTRQLQQARCARGVVHRAVEDAVARGVRLAHADVVPVTGVENGLVRVGRPLQLGHHVVGGDLVGLHVELGVDGRAGQFDRLEVAAAGLDLLLLEVEAGVSEQVHGHVALDPGLHRHALGRGVGAHDVELRHGPGVGHRGPAIGGRARLVDDQHAGRALTRRLFVLVGPATVIGHRLAAKGVQRGLLKVGVIDQNHDDLAAHVGLEVVPLALGRAGAITHED